MRKLLLFAALVFGLALGLVQRGAAQSQQVLVLTVRGAVTPAMASYFERGIREGDARGAAAVVVVLDTPGGALNTTLEIVGQFRNARVPVVVYVGPAGAQAASAGSIITMAAHAAAMAPETVIGAAAVVGGQGEDLGETLARKQTQDLQATVRNLTERRGPEVVALAESMIDEARAVTASEALAVGLIDVIATDLDSLLEQLDGLEVTVNNRPQTLATAGARQVELPLTAVEQVLLWLSNPLVISFLLAIAVPAILIELQSPGGWVAGFIGVTCLVLALYGYGQLPTNWLGLVLVGIAFVLLLLEVKTATGAMAVVGTLTLLAGLLVLFNSPGSPEFARISVPGAIAISLFAASFFLFISTKALQAQQRQPYTGQEGMIGLIGEVRTPLTPRGSILVHGEIWRARADREMDKGARVVVRSVDGFTLNVEPVDGADNGRGAGDAGQG